ncbi:MAG: biopolymer transporter ExbD [Dysgonamonadaceae bacterium]|jgi:biopolymer transport protein ExbD|nr:biopolymer transporter ExbD [Dysgonamonadaceae bacterium]
MSKVKVKKQSTFIDMTAMSDVTVLLLTFFMTTSTFLAKEPIQVTTPASVSEIKIPETNLLTILVDKDGKVFLSMDNAEQKVATLKAVSEPYGITYTAKQIEAFRKLQSFGVPIRYMQAFLDLPVEKQDKELQNLENKRVGVPADDGKIEDGRGVISSDNEFKRWVAAALDINKDLRIAIKSDQTTNYPVVKKIIDILRGDELRQNRYLLITTLREGSSN